MRQVRDYIRTSQFQMLETQLKLDKAKERELNCSHTWKSSGEAGFSPGCIRATTHVLGCSLSVSLLCSPGWLCSQAASPHTAALAQQLQVGMGLSTCLFPHSSVKSSLHPAVSSGASLSGQAWWAETTKATH